MNSLEGYPAVGGRSATTMIEGGKSFDVTVRWPLRLRWDEQTILAIPVPVTNNQVTATSQVVAGGTPTGAGGTGLSPVGTSVPPPSVYGTILNVPPLANVAPLLGLAAAATGIMVLASPSPSQRTAQPGEHPEHGTSGSVLPGLADGYVMAVALLVIGWVVAFGSEFHRSGERPSSFLLDLLHPLADLAVLGALLPVLTVAWRRVLVTYLALLMLTVADFLGVGARISGGHQGILEQLAMILAACLLGVAPWVPMIAARLGLPVWRSEPVIAGNPPVQAELLKLLLAAESGAAG